ncbi:DoxX family protein [uncultured Aquimarina sp.]|uniref:DoxX family protein n=1 Tax=uncultured Aquimarina sp. TaxID=575652 RepID=UPI002619C928|nr:DoxX family protein [uncultured Aquimarina sp.]
MKAIYWSTTILLSAFLLWSAYTYMFHKPTIQGVKILGFPDHFRIQIAVLKIIALVVIIIPQFPIQVKEWAYVGVILFFITAIVAHTAHKDPFIITLVNLFLIVVTIISNLYLHRIANLH